MCVCVFKMRKSFKSTTDYIYKMYIQVEDNYKHDIRPMIRTPLSIIKDDIDCKRIFCYSSIISNIIFFPCTKYMKIIHFIC